MHPDQRRPGERHLSGRRVRAARSDQSRRRIEHHRPPLGRGEIYKLDTSAEEWRIEPQADGFMMPGDNPALASRLEAHGWDLADERQDERRLLELLNHQRAVADILPDGARFSTVGAFAQHTVITAAGISTRIVKPTSARPSAVGCPAN